MRIRKILYGGVTVAALAAGGIGVTAGTASASTNCSYYLGQYYYYNSLGDTSYSLAQ